MEFSQLAITKLLQLFPELANYIVTFKDITQDSNMAEDSDISIGVFIMRFGAGYQYIPVVAKGETVQPIDSIFDIETQQFYPLIKSYVNNIINSSAIDMGKSTPIPSTLNKNPSVYDLVVPPRTGKYVYASTSRLSDFLSELPNIVKEATLEKFSSDSDIYNALHRLFGLEAVMSALKPKETPIVAAPKPAVQVVREGHGLPNEAVQSILEKGYALTGANVTTRVAVLANDFDAYGKIFPVTSTDADRDVDVVLKNGNIISAYIPKRSPAVPLFPVLLTRKDTGTGEPTFAMFANGDYAISGNIVARGEGRADKKVVTDLFGFKKPSVPKDVAFGETIAILSPELDLVGVFHVVHVSASPNGVSIQGRNMIGANYWGNGIVNIAAFRNVQAITSSGSTLFIPYESLVVKLGKDLSNDLEPNVNSARDKLEFSTLSALGSAADIGFDGVEFIYNGNPVGDEGNLVEILVVKEGVEPSAADSFIKQAKERRHVKIYLSKKADFEPSDVPSYGAVPGDVDDPLDTSKMSGRFTGNLKESLQTNDPQTVEATIISELLQVANMKEYVREYLPEVKEAIDKLGRTLLLSRLKIEDLSKTHSASELNSFLANLRNVYRMLGENYLKLEQMASDSEAVPSED